MTNKSLIAALFSVLFVLVACGGSESEAPTASEPMAEPAVEPMPEPMEEARADLRSLLASDSRSAEDQARDAGRKPADVVEFLGIESGMRVIDVIAAGGYYTEVLTLAVGPEGHVVASFYAARKLRELLRHSLPTPIPGFAKKRRQQTT